MCSPVKRERRHVPADECVARAARGVHFATARSRRPRRHRSRGSGDEAWLARSCTRSRPARRGRGRDGSGNLQSRRRRHRCPCLYAPMRNPPGARKRRSRALPLAGQVRVVRRCFFVVSTLRLPVAIVDACTGVRAIRRPTDSSEDGRRRCRRLRQRRFHDWRKTKAIGRLAVFAFRTPLAVGTNTDVVSMV